MEQVRLLSTTTVLTALIWASADSLVNEAVSVNVAFDVVPAAGAMDMQIEVTGSSDAFELQISGPRRVVEAVQEQAPLRVKLRVAQLSTTGAQRIRLDRAWLKQEFGDQFNEFRKLSIISIQPDSLPVMVDHWVAKEVELVLGRLTLAYDVEPQLSRTVTSVRMRRSKLDALPDGQALQIDMSSDVERLLKEQPAGERVAVRVNIDTRILGSDAKADPASVEVTATTKAQRRTAKIPTVPIRVAVSFANLERPYAAVSREGTPMTLVTRTITVTGPTEDVDRLEQGTTRAYGVIHLKEADVERLNELMLLTPEFHLPPGITLLSVPDPIELKLIDRNAAESGS